MPTKVDWTEEDLRGAGIRVTLFLRQGGEIYGTAHRNEHRAQPALGKIP